MALSLTVLNEHIAPEVCAPCGGKCCKGMPGAVLPTELGSDEESIRDELTRRLLTGNWTIDWWDGDPRDSESVSDDYVDRGYFVRPATVGKRFAFEDPSWGGRCVFHTESGCRIFAERPSGCRGLRPSADGKCVPEHASKQEVAVAWIPYHLPLRLALDDARFGGRYEQKAGRNG